MQRLRDHPIFFLTSLAASIIAIFGFLGYQNLDALRSAFSPDHRHEIAIPTPTPRDSQPVLNVDGVSSPLLRKPWDKPHFYLHIADESQRKPATELRRFLLKRGYVVSGIENVAGSNGIPGVSSELRYFTPEDSLEAQRFVKELSPLFAPTGLYADNPPDMPYVSHSRQYEIWFSLAFR